MSRDFYFSALLLIFAYQNQTNMSNLLKAVHRIHSSAHRHKPAVQTDSYSLDSSYYTKSFGSISALIEDVQSSGMDPNTEVLKNGKLTGEKLFDLMEI